MGEALFPSQLWMFVNTRSKLTLDDLVPDEPNNLEPNSPTVNDVTPNRAWIHPRLTGRATNGVAIADIISDITRLTPLHSTQCTFSATAGPRPEKCPISDDTPTVNTTKKSAHESYHFTQGLLGHNKIPI